MICKIADLVTQISAAGGMAPRCEKYAVNSLKPIDVIIDASLYKLDIWPNLTNEQKIYLQSGFQFYRRLIDYEGMMLHASAVEMDGEAFLFSGPCGRGKSTHAKQWQLAFGDKAQVFNDDKPALRRIEGQWFAFGTPWCGKDGINQNKKVPLKGICFLVQAQDNVIRRVGAKEALGLIINQTTYKLKDPEQMMKLLYVVDMLIREVPIFELKNRPEPEAAMISYEAMHHSTKE